MVYLQIQTSSLWIFGLKVGNITRTCKIKRNNVNGGDYVSMGRCFSSIAKGETLNKLQT